MSAYEKAGYIIAGLCIQGSFDVEYKVYVCKLCGAYVQSPRGQHHGQYHWVDIDTTAKDRCDLEGRVLIPSQVNVRPLDKIELEIYLRREQIVRNEPPDWGMYLSD